MEIQTTIVYDKLQQAVEQGYEIISAQGSSRCFAEGTLVRMFDGTLKAVEHIAIGDKVMNMHGTGYNTVVEVHSGIDDMYKVHQHRGIDYVVNSKHILTFKDNDGYVQNIETDFFHQHQSLLLDSAYGYKSDGTKTPIEFTSYVGKGKYYGFTLDNSPYFLLQDGTVVHNSGKTRNIMIWLIIWALQHENRLITITRCSLPTIRGSVFRDFIEVMQQLGIYKSRSLNKTHLTYILDNGTEFEFIPTENDDKLRGRRRDVLYCNEANETSYEAYNQLAMRTDVLKILDYNPSFDEDHWLNDLNRDKRTYHFITTYKDNPFISQTIIDEIESLQWKNPSLWQIFGLGQRAIVEGLIFKKFTVEKSIPSIVKKRWVGVDFGFTNDPTAIILVGQQDDNLYLKEIEYKKGMLTEHITEVLCSKELRNYEIICDSADPRLIKEIRLVAKNKYKVELHVTPVKKSNNSIMPSIDKMTLYNLVVTENSYNVIKELKSYTYVKDREGKWLNKPIDKFNHSIDAVRYVVMERLLGKKKRRGLRITR